MGEVHIIALPEDTSVHARRKIAQHEPYIFNAASSDGIVYNE
jgi:hypothetical protein